MWGSGRPSDKGIYRNWAQAWPLPCRGPPSKNALILGHYPFNPKPKKIKLD